MSPSITMMSIKELQDLIEQCEVELEKRSQDGMKPYGFIDKYDKYQKDFSKKVHKIIKQVPKEVE